MFLTSFSYSQCESGQTFERAEFKMIKSNRLVIIRYIFQLFNYKFRTNSWIRANQVVLSKKKHLIIQNSQKVTSFVSELSDSLHSSDSFSEVSFSSLIFGRTLTAARVVALVFTSSSNFFFQNSSYHYQSHYQSLLSSRKLVKESSQKLAGQFH